MRSLSQPTIICIAITPNSSKLMACAAHASASRGNISGTRNELVTRADGCAIKVLKDAGAELVDPVELPSFSKIGDAEYQVLLYEFKDGIERYLATRPIVRHKTLADLIAFNERNADKRTLAFSAQETFLRAEKCGPLTEQTYLDALEKCRKLSRDGRHRCGDG